MKQEAKMNWDGITGGAAENYEREATEVRLPHSSEEIEQLLSQLQGETIRDTFEKLAFDKPAAAAGVRLELPPEVRKDMIAVLLKVERLATRLIDRRVVSPQPLRRGESVQRSASSSTGLAHRRRGQKTTSRLD